MSGLRLYSQESQRNIYWLDNEHFQTLIAKAILPPSQNTLPIDLKNLSQNDLPPVTWRKSPGNKTLYLLRNYMLMIGVNDEHECLFF